ncbi:MAG: tetratricopeptide repeat protein, partial [Deltaproteobacteria bacterium]|nr:tetratricopeptide repeat protein [Deltaproteobacteria bacterium]
MRALLRLAESARRTGALEDAEEVLEEAAELGVDPLRALAALGRVYVERGRYEQAIATHYRRLEHERGEGRVTLLVEIGDLAAEKLKDAAYAAKSYLAALSEQPSDRRVLGKLMQVYSAEKDWERLVSVVVKLADFVDDDRQKAKYLHTAGRIAWKELGSLRRGAELLGRALALDPDAEAIARDAVEVHASAGDAEGLKESLKRQVKIASDAGDKEQLLRSLGALAELYLRRFGRLDQAIAVTEAALEVDPTDVNRREALAALYASDPGRYMDRAVLAQHEILARDPFRPDAHRTLRRLHTDGQNPDAAWCACQALVVLGQAEQEEARFYQRMRSEEGITAKASLDEPDFHRMLMHPAAEPLVTALFTVIQPAVMAARLKTLRQLGFGPDKLVDPGRADLASAQVLPYAAEILGMACPPLFHDPDDYGELSFIHAQHPSVVIGTAIAGVALPIQTLAFVSARHLTFYRQGLYVRQLVPTVTGLKAWLFAAIRLMVPAFPVPPDLAGPVGEAVGAIDRVVTGPARDHLAQVVSRLIQEGTALDLRRWVAGVDLTADRAGLLVSDDLSTAVEVIRTADAASSAVPAEERVEELFPFSVSEGYLAARRAI